MPDFTALNSLDWTILAVMGWSVGWATYRGFSNELFSLLGLIAAFVVTIYAGHLLDDMMMAMVPDNAIARMFGRMIVFLAFIICINFVSGMGAQALRAMLSRLVDHSFGLLFGFIRATLLILLPFLLINLYIDPKIYPDWLTHAHAYPFLQSGAHVLRQVLPASQIHDNERTDLKSMDQATSEQDKLRQTLDETNGTPPPKPVPAALSDQNQKTAVPDKEKTSHASLKDLFKVIQELFTR